MINDVVNGPIFITGIGTGVGKTVASAIVTEALKGGYWKPIQCGFEDITDSQFVKKLISYPECKIHEEDYKLRLSASPHIAAKEENIKINIENIYNHYCQLAKEGHPIIIEGAGGIMVPLNEKEFVIDLIQKLNAKVILVSRNYLGSINHSLLTAEICRQKKINILGWIFNDQFMAYEEDIVQWSAFAKIGSIPFTDKISKEFVSKQAAIIKSSLLSFLL